MREVYRSLQSTASIGVAVCLMPDHLHLLLELGSCPLASVVQRIKGCSSRACGIGRLWQPNYFDRRLRREDDLGTAIRYVLQNPLKAQLVDDLRRWPWWNCPDATAVCPHSGQLL
jgi:putative transposase